MANANQLAQQMTAVAQSLDAQSSLDELLHVLVRSARDTIPAVEFAGVSVARKNGTIDTIAATDPIVMTVDRIQYTLMEGPCVDAVRGHGRSTVDNLVSDRRWPRYGPRAAALGLVSQMGVELHTEDESLGALNLYSSKAAAFDQDAPFIADLFASHAALAMGKAIREDQWLAALATRKVIGQALGIVMERYELDEHRAFAFLTRVSQTSNIKLRRVAEEVVGDANERVHPDGSPAEETTGN